MRRKTFLFLFAVSITSLALSACTGLLPQSDEPLTGDYGSPYTPREHQLRTFDVLWKDLQENYIYFDSAEVDWDSLRSKYVDRIDGGLTNDEFTALLHQLEGDLPPGTLTYQSRAERIKTEISDNSTYGGIGAFIGFQAEPVPHIVILAVMDGSPAEKAGLRAHDSLIKIDGTAITLDEGIDAVQRVRGPAGTNVALTVLSPGGSERVVDVTRAQLTSTSRLEAYEIKGTPYAYMLIPPMASNTMMTDIIENLRAFTTNKTLEGLILDLRVAGSARGWPLDQLFTLFHDGEIGEFFNRSNSETATLNGQDMFGSQNVPLVILVGKNTSGSPEMLAGSLQAHKRAVVVGEATPGAIEATTAFPLPDGSRIFIETTSFRLPDGGEIGIDGVQPDILVEAGWDDVLPGNDPVFDKALEVLEAQK